LKDEDCYVCRKFISGHIFYRRSDPESSFYLKIIDEKEIAFFRNFIETNVATSIFDYNNLPVLFSTCIDSPNYRMLNIKAVSALNFSIKEIKKIES